LSLSIFSAPQFINAHGLPKFTSVSPLPAFDVRR
jgi:hypothetical protein